MPSVAAPQKSQGPTVQRFSLTSANHPWSFRQQTTSNMQHDCQRVAFPDKRAMVKLVAENSNPHTV